MNHPLTLDYVSVTARVPSCMMEITTNVGCTVNCRFCPQKTLLRAYKSPTRNLSLDDFQKALDKLPEGTIVIFSGFSEPFLNKDCARMVLCAAKRGHPVSIFTTGTGLSVEDLERIQDIPFSAFPHGGFVLHLADAEGHAKITVDDGYLRLLRAIKKAAIQDLRLRTMGTLHPDIEPIFPARDVKRQSMHDRAGYLTAEGVTVEREVQSLKGAAAFCGRDEHVYNNVMLPNGDVVLCCQDFGLRHVLGNLLRDEYSQLVPPLLATYDLCRSCVHGIGLPVNFPRLQCVRA